MNPSNNTYFQIIKFMTEEQQRKIINHISSVRIYDDVKFIIYQFMTSYPFPDKKISLFLKMNTQKQKLGFINRYFIRAAYEYGVPKTYIKDLISTKDNDSFYINYKQYDNIISRKIDRKLNLHIKSRLFYEAVLEQMNKKNSRKEKIYKIVENIKNN